MDIAKHLTLGGGGGGGGGGSDNFIWNLNIIDKNLPEV
jgi:hypothetical protein